MWLDKLYRQIALVRARNGRTYVLDYANKFGPCADGSYPDSIWQSPSYLSYLLARVRWGQAARIY